MNTPGRVVVMAKVPRAGHSKTRLAGVLGLEGAAALSRAMTADVLATVHAAGLPFRVSVAGDLADPWVAGLDAPVEAQRGDDLGACLRHALREGGIAIGTDSPTLPAALLHDAARALVTHDVAWAPAFDGGYVLVAARASALAVFDDIPWSSAETLAVSVERARAAGLRAAALPFWYDVDAPADLVFLRNHLRALSPAVAPRTRAFLQELPDAAPDR